MITALANNVWVQLGWALLAALVALSYMESGNDAFLHVSSHLIHSFTVASLFLALFIAPWLYSWLKIKNRTPLLFDSLMPLIIAKLLAMHCKATLLFDFFRKEFLMEIDIPVWIFTFLILRFCLIRGKGYIASCIILTAFYFIILGIVFPGIQGAIKR